MVPFMTFRNELLTRQRQHVLEILQMRHERVQIAFQHRLAALGQREEVMPARLRHRLPIFRPRRGCGPIGKSPRPNQDRRRREVDDPARADRCKERMSRRTQQAITIEHLATSDQRRRLFEQSGNIGERFYNSGVGGVRKKGHAILRSVLQCRHWRPMMT
jgi:hypothetical protein